MPRTRYCHRCLTTFDDAPERCTNLSCGVARPSEGWGVVLGPGDVLDRHYRVERALAVGGAGLTYLARELDADGAPAGPQLAIKVLYAQRDQGSFLRRLANEAQVLQELADEHIIECRGFVQRTGHPPYLVTLFERGGNLGDHLDRHGALPPRVAAGILRQILLALDAAHQRAVVHRDLKPENVLLREPVDRDVVPQVRVADFGIAKVPTLGDRLTRQGAFVGTPEYAAPEQFLGREPTPATDVFAAGALFWTLLTDHGLVAFSDRMDAERSLDELMGGVPPVVPPEIGSDAECALLQRVLDGMLQVRPESRFTIQQVLVALDGLIEGEPRQALQTLELTAAADDAPAPPRPMPDASAMPVEIAAEPEATEEEAPQGGCAGVLLGLGVPLLLVAVGLPLVVGGLVGGAWARGWFAGPPDPAEAETVKVVRIAIDDARPPVRDLDGATDPADAAERDHLQEELDAVLPDIARTCVVAIRNTRVRVSPRGRIRQVDVHPPLPEPGMTCVRRRLRRVRLTRTTPGDVWVPLHATDPV